jgi:hypothetical protein
MQRKDHTPEGAAANQKVLDAYFKLSKQKPAYRTYLAMRIWQSWTPETQVKQQQAAHKLAQGNLALSESYTQSILLLEYAKRQLQAEQGGAAPFALFSVVD